MRKRFLSALIAATCVTTPICAFAQSWSVRPGPDAPRAQQQTHAIVRMPSSEGCSELVGVRQDFNLITVEARRESRCIDIIGPQYFEREIAIGALPKGEYRLRVVDVTVANRPPLSEESAFAVAPPPAGRCGANGSNVAATMDYSGLWWDPARAGEGWFVEHRFPDRLMLSWLTYTDDGKATWYVMHADDMECGYLSGPVYATQGTPPHVALRRVGSASFQAFQGNFATFAFTPTAAETRISFLQRQPF